MGSEFIAAGAGLIGAIIGALASLGGVMIVERNRARQLRRERYLTMFADAVLGRNPTKAVESKIWLAVLGNHDRIHEWGSAQSPQQVFGALAGMLLDVVNDERAAHGLDRLSITELTTLVPFGTGPISADVT